MISLRNPILATILYYDCFDFPLTLMEVMGYLINPSRIIMISGGVGEISLDNVSGELDRLVNSKIIGEKNGFYFISGREYLYDLRIEREKISAGKWKKFLKLVRLLSLAPYLRGVFASGSMAINNTDSKSDFDVLIIAKAGRLYTCRLFLWVISSLIGKRRKKDEKVAPDKLCFNHYITDSRLYMGHESLFNAETYISLKPVMVSRELQDKFYSSNLWLNNYVYNFHPHSEFVRRTVKPSPPLRFIAATLEFILDSVLGDKLEAFAMRFQQKKIKNNPVTYKSGGRIVASDHEIEFHPYSFEKTVLDRYKEGLRRLGIIPYIEEKDSGLRV